MNSSKSNLGMGGIAHGVVVVGLASARGAAAGGGQPYTFVVGEEPLYSELSTLVFVFANNGLNVTLEERLSEFDPCPCVLQSSPDLPEVGGTRLALLRFNSISSFTVSSSDK